MTDTDYNYIVCDRCGRLWAVDADEADPAKCLWCKHRALWRFDTFKPAAEHSATVNAAKAAKL